MVKVVIKKNIKPKKKVMKQKQNQKQTININIGDTITKKKRGRPSKKAQQAIPVKKPIQQPIAPVIQSYNQPIFNKPTSQPSLLSSILATQEKPSIIAKEKKEESALTKALIEQNTQTEDAEPKVNDLERVRTERLKKFDKPTLPQSISTQTIPTESIATQTRPIPSTETIIQQRPFYPSFKKITEESNPVKTGLLSQILSDQGDDSEEINQLINGFVLSRRTDSSLSPFFSIPNPLSRLKVDDTEENNETIRSTTEGLLRPTASFPNPLSRLNLPSVSNITNYLDSFLDEEETIPKKEINTEDPYARGVEETKEETILQETKDDEPLRNQQQEPPRQITEPIQSEPLITQEDIPDYTQKQLNDYKKYTEEVKKLEQPIDTTGEEQANEAINLIQGILKPVETTPTILEDPKQEPAITQSLQAEEEETPLVKKKKSKKALQAEEEEETPLELKSPDLEEPLLEPLVKTKKTKKAEEKEPTLKVSLIQAETKWRELETAGLMPNRTRPNGTRKGKQELLDEIREIDPEWEIQFLK
jgi:hypothetical protein